MWKGVSTSISTLKSRVENVPVNLRGHLGREGELSGFVTVEVPVINVKGVCPSFILTVRSGGEGGMKDCWVVVPCQFVAFPSTAM